MKTENSSAIDQDTFNALKDSMGEVFEDILSVFLDETESLVLTIKEKIDANDLEAITMTAHTLKSSTKTLGANRLSDICAQIEALNNDNKEEVDTLYMSLVLEKHAAFEEIRGMLAPA